MISDGHKGIQKERAVLKSIKQTWLELSPMILQVKSIYRWKMNRVSKDTGPG